MGKLLWKSMKADMKSGYDDSQWKIGEWRREKPPTQECIGFNACTRIINAMNYVNMDILAQVEVGGKIIKGDKKQTCGNMRIVRAWKWTKMDSVALSIFAAESAIRNFETLFPEDDRPRQAIEAAKKYLENSAYTSAKIFDTAWSAGYAAESAGYAARSAGYVARSAAAASAAIDALDKIESWLVARVKTLEEYKHEERRQYDRT